MFSWLKNIFRPSRDPYKALPHYARLWLATETASIYAPLLVERWPETPHRFPRRLNWSLKSLRDHITGSDLRPRKVRLAILQSLTVAGGAMQRGRQDVFEIATIIRCAAEAAEKGADESQAHLDEVLSYANDYAVRMERPDLWHQVDSIALKIAELTRNWDDKTMVPLNLISNRQET
jgi:hypothetical protein